MSKSSKVTISIEDRPDFISLQWWLTIQNGRSVTQAQVIKWLLETTLQQRQQLAVVKERGVAMKRES